MNSDRNVWLISIEVMQSLNHKNYAKAALLPALTHQLSGYRHLSKILRVSLVKTHHSRGYCQVESLKGLSSKRYYLIDEEDRMTAKKSLSATTAELFARAALFSRFQVIANKRITALSC